MSNQTTEQHAFPIFDADAMQAIARYAEPVAFEKNDVLIKQGDKNFPFYVIKSGEIRIVERDGGEERFVINHGPGHFTGDVDMITGRSAVITAIANEPVEAFQLCATRLRKLLNGCPDVGEFLLNAFQARRQLLEASAFVGVRLIGESNTVETARMREFFYKNHVPHTYYESNSDEGQQQLARLQSEGSQLPVVQCNDKVVNNPSLPQLAECIGITKNVDGQLFDLVIVGCGPAGLAAAVYASSEAINTLVIDSVGPGGQAGSSSKIENFIGFPTGLSGSELAHRGYLQALKFGATFIAPITVESIEQDSSGEHHLKLCSGQTVRARCVLVASGVTYRQLDIPGFERLEGAGVYYAATSVESRICEDSTAVVVGGGNSAGQAAMFLTKSAKEVKVLIRGGDLTSRMSSYLSERVLKHPNIEVVKQTEVTRVIGERHVESVEVTNNQTGKVSTISCAALFAFIGAQPHSTWLPKSVLRDEKGFVLAGSSIPSGELEKRWKLDRAPCDLETTVPGIMVAGDVRSGTTKRCGFAVGDGSLAVSCVHRYLSEIDE